MTDSDVSQDHYYMQAALNLSLRGLGNTWPNPSVGTVIVKKNKIVSRGWTKPSGRPHAEIVALNKNKKLLFRGATLYTTLEPCSHFGKTSPCVDAIINAKIKRVVIATKDINPNIDGKAIKKLKKKKIKVTLGILEKEAKKINLGFFQKIKINRPSISTKIAISKNGMITDPTTKWITSEHSRSYGQFIRAKHDAVMTGINTVLKDNPLLTCRLPGMEKYSPVRVVLDSNLKIKENLRIVQTSKKIKTYLFTLNNMNKLKIKKLKDYGLKIIFIKPILNSMNINLVLEELSKIGLNNILLEAGAKLNSSFFSQNLINKIYYFESQKIIKFGGLSLFKKLKINRINDLKFRMISTKNLIDDKLIIYER